MQSQCFSTKAAQLLDSSTKGGGDRQARKARCKEVYAKCVIRDSALGWTCIQTPANRSQGEHYGGPTDHIQTMAIGAPPHLPWTNKI